MKILLLLAVVVAFGLLQAHGAIWNFGSMLGKVIGKKALIDYSLYGCYCGFRGKGTPKDATDQCCFERDCCYRRLREEGCRTKFVHYKFEYKKDQVTCVDQNPCRKKLCECDKTAALCFKENRNSYNKTYRFYSGRWCQGKSPQC